MSKLEPVMSATSKRTVATLSVVVALTTMLGLTATPAVARVAAANAKFCAVLSSEEGAGIDFEGLGPAEATFAAKLMRKAAKTGVPGSLKADLGKLAKIYDRIADGESAAKVLSPSQQKAILPALTRFSKYTAANCAVPVPTT
jgi:hypothetical protein